MAERDQKNADSAKYRAVRNTGSVKNAVQTRQTQKERRMEGKGGLMRVK